MSRKRLVGASIIPVSRDPIYDNLYFLLGRERRFPAWNDSETWSDFGGSVRYNPLNNEGESAESCASREAWEETMCMLKLTPSVGAFMDSSAQIEYALTKHRYIIKAEISQPDGATYTTWLVEVPWDPEFSNNFSRASRTLRMYAKDPSSINAAQLARIGFDNHPAIKVRHPSNLISVDSAFLEKTSIALYSVPRLLRALSDNNCLLRKGNRTEFLRNTFASRLRIVLKHIGCLPNDTIKPSLSGISWALGSTPSSQPGTLNEKTEWSDESEDDLKPLTSR